jgi:hypothetical protein
MESIKEQYVDVVEENEGAGHGSESHPGGHKATIRGEPRIETKGAT